MTKRSHQSRQPGEQYWAWQSRLARERQEVRDRMAPIVPAEALQHGEYEQATIIHVETGTRVETVRRGISSLVRMHGNGTLTNDQYGAAMRIQRVAERIGRDVSTRSANLEGWVDNSSGPKGMLSERLSQVHDEMAYSKWRLTLPMPRQMILDMILVDRPLSRTARLYRMDWPRAKRLFLASLDKWGEIYQGIHVTRQDVDNAHARAA